MGILENAKAINEFDETKDSSLKSAKSSCFLLANGCSGWTITLSGSSINEKNSKISVFVGVVQTMPISSVPS